MAKFSEEGAQLEMAFGFALLDQPTLIVRRLFLVQRSFVIADF
jgi:hypothetical protein